MRTKQIAIAALCTSLFSGCTTDSSQESQSLDKIIGGREAPQSAFPWMAHLFGPPEWFDEESNEPTDRRMCGGILIDAEQGIVLTAAHCVALDILRCDGELCPQGTTDETGGAWTTVALPTHFFQVAVGFHRMSDLAPEDLLDVVEIFIHPGYTEWDNDNDIALLRVEGIDPTSPTPQIIGERPYDHWLRFPGRRATTMGWGTTDPAVNTLPDALQMVSVPLISNAECVQRYESAVYPVTDTMICAGFSKGGRDSCYGDSGGPLTVQDPHDPGRGPLVTGIVSWGGDCAAPEEPGVYTDIIHFRPWLDACLADLGGCERLPDVPDDEPL